MGRVKFDSKPSTPEHQLRKIFKKFVNNEHRLGKQELKEAFEYLGSIIPGFRANRALHHADANEDGFIDEEEMNELVNYAIRVGFTCNKKSSGIEALADEQLRKIFKRYDINNDGQLSREVLKKACQYLDSVIPGFGVDHANANGENFNEEEGMNELVKHAARLGYTISGGTVTDDQLRKIFKQYDVKNDGQLSRADIKKAYQYHNKEELNKLVKDAVRVGFTVKP
ncbi:uncharacterized protein LOC126710987 [Quercus robur]|uniref:uncharacterized protein LOC126710987 n=1 Tax=Quercus robur TaxID=38942 RepID=UPI002163EA45|nr:uncharacterized protein LOC126710987 [Quercus robur]XP_050267189.1 uncharacterized protein LOC126710987 [Quercus robur]